MKKILSTVMSLLFIAAIFSSCGLDSSYTENNISIEGNPESGFEWVCSIEKPDIAALSDTAYKSENNSGVYTFTLKGLSAGKTKATFKYIDPISDSAVSVRIYNIKVDDALTVKAKLIKEENSVSEIQTESVIVPPESMESQLQSAEVSEESQLQPTDTTDTISETEKKPEAPSSPLSLEEAQLKAVEYINSEASELSEYSVEAWHEYNIYVDGEKFYKFRMSRLTENGKYSFLKNVIVSFSGDSVLDYAIPENDTLSNFWSFDEIARANNFATEIIDAVKSKSMKELSSMIQYPITVENGESEITFSDMESFAAADPDLIFTEKFTESFSKISSDEMSSNYYEFILGENPGITFTEDQNGNMLITSLR